MTAELKKVLQGGLVLLRPLVEDDLRIRAHWMTDPQILSMMGFPETVIPEKVAYNRALSECHKWLKKRVEHGDYVWAVDVDGEIIGDITAHVYDTQRRAELFILIGNKKMWGMGLGKEACTLVLNEIFTRSDLYYVDTYITPKNTRSLSLALSLGFTTFGTQTGGTKVLRLTKKSWDDRRSRLSQSL